MHSNIAYRVCTDRDREAVVDFLYTLRDELALDKRAVAEEIVDLLTVRGNAFAGFLDGKIIALIGYFHGDPSNDFEDDDVCFIYVSGIAREFQCSRVFLDGYRAAMRELAQYGYSEVRCQAAENNRYTNRLYARLFRYIGSTTNRRGLPVKQYSLPFSEAAQRLAA